MIAGTALSLILIALFVLCFVKKSRSRKMNQFAPHDFQEDSSSNSSIHSTSKIMSYKDAEYDGPTDSNSSESATYTLPVYSSQNSQSQCVVAAVPAFYRAACDYTGRVEGELSLFEQGRVYVVSRPDEGGWCWCKISGEEGWVHVSNLTLLG
ncbi:UNVERIFIED_CONTAM: hypothetical protein HDU68_002452 [Siphonaria sp. JEL0065]|nr:hypothetical protein HDU68_002452 [Siphonaria sp. JEL0065]